MTFEERLRDSMIAAACDTPGDLSRRMAKAKTPMSARRLAVIAAHPEKMLADELLGLCVVLNVRVRWLRQELGPVAPVGDSPQDAEAIAILGAMPARKVKMWLRWGRNLIS